MRRFSELFALFEELRRLKQRDLVEAEGIRDPIKRAYALVAAQERIERVERKIEEGMCTSHFASEERECWEWRGVPQEGEHDV